MPATLELAYLGTTHTCLPVCLLQPRLLAKQGHPCGKHIQFLPSLEMLFSLIQITAMVEYESLQNDGMEKKHHVQIWQDRTHLLRRKTQWKQVELIQPAEHSEHTFSTLGHSRKQGPHLINLHPKHKGSAGSSALPAERTNTASLILKPIHK